MGESNVTGSKSPSLIEQLAQWIPGYRGFRELDQRRQDDAAVRQYVSRRLQDCKRALDRLGEQALAAGDLDGPARLEKIRTRIQLAQSRVAAAVEGYASWFSRRTVDAALLDEVHQLDAGLITLADRIEVILKGTESASAAAAHVELAELVEELHQRLDRRAEVLQGEAR
jgi:hypothetical protein